MMTQEKSTQKSCLISTLYAEDSLAKAFRSLENEKDSAIPEELSSLRSPELPPLKSLSICSLKMFPVCYRITVLASHDGQDVCDHHRYVG